MLWMFEIFARSPALEAGTGRTMLVCGDQWEALWSAPQRVTLHVMWHHQDSNCTKTGLIYASRACLMQWEQKGKSFIQEQAWFLQTLPLELWCEVSKDSGSLERTFVHLAQLTVIPLLKPRSHMPQIILHLLNEDLVLYPCCELQLILIYLSWSISHVPLLFWFFSLFLSRSSQVYTSSRDKHTQKYGVYCR